MPHNDRDPFAPDGAANDGLGMAQTTDRATWGDPDPGAGSAGLPAHLPAEGYDYGDGIIVGAGVPDADAQAAHAARLIRARTDAPHSYELPHEATHRRYEPLLIVSVAQLAAGYTAIGPALPGLHYVKVVAACLTLDAAGTIKFVQGSNDGNATSRADLTGALAMGGGAAPQLLLPPADLQNPWLYTSADQALGIFTATGKAAGWITIAYAPFDS